MTAGTYIVAICACGGLIACFGFIWAIRSGDLSNADEAKWLVFDDDELMEAQTGSRADGQSGHPRP